MTSVVIKVGEADLDTEKDLYKGRTPCEYEGRALLAKEGQKLPANHQMMGGSLGTDSPSRSLEQGTNPADTLIWDL